MNVMIVDDEEGITYSLQYALSKEGVEVQTAKSGNEAFSLVQINPPLVLFTDVDMHDGDGISLVKNIRNARHCFPIFLMTGGRTRLNKELNDLKVELIFIKPMNVDMVIKTIMNKITELKAEKI